MNKNTTNTLGAGSASVGTSAAQVVTADTPIRREVTLLAASGNVGSIYIGDSTVDVSGAAEGFALKPDLGTSLNIDNLNKVYAISQTAGNRLHWFVT
jgi:hypothetical protein